MERNRMEWNEMKWNELEQYFQKYHVWHLLFSFKFPNLQVPEDVMMKCRFSYIEQGDPVSLEQLSQNISDPGIEDGYHAYLDNCFAGLLQVTRS